MKIKWKFAVSHARLVQRDANHTDDLYKQFFVEHSEVFRVRLASFAQKLQLCSGREKSFVL